jgi:hypothetical protein
MRRKNASWRSRRRRARWSTARGRKRWCFAWRGRNGMSGSPGLCREAARAAGLSEGEIAAFMDEAMAGDYDPILHTTMRWFEIR